MKSISRTGISFFTPMSTGWHAVPRLLVIFRLRFKMPSPEKVKPKMGRDFIERTVHGRYLLRPQSNSRKVKYGAGMSDVRVLWFVVGSKINVVHLDNKGVASLRTFI